MEAPITLCALCKENLEIIRFEVEKLLIGGFNKNENTNDMLKTKITKLKEIIVEVESEMGVIPCPPFPLLINFDRDEADLILEQSKALDAGNPFRENVCPNVRKIRTDVDYLHKEVLNSENILSAQNEKVQKLEFYLSQIASSSDTMAAMPISKPFLRPDQFGTSEEEERQFLGLGAIEDFSQKLDDNNPVVPVEVSYEQLRRDVVLLQEKQTSLIPVLLMQEEQIFQLEHKISHPTFSNFRLHAGVSHSNLDLQMAATSSPVSFSTIEKQDEIMKLSPVSPPNFNFTFQPCLQELDLDSNNDFMSHCSP